jgi:hypothetical protein
MLRPFRDTVNPLKLSFEQYCILVAMLPTSLFVGWGSTQIVPWIFDVALPTIGRVLFRVFVG